MVALRSVMPTLYKKSELESNNRLFCRSWDVFWVKTRCDRWSIGTPFLVNLIVSVKSVDSTRQLAYPDVIKSRQLNWSNSRFCVFDFELLIVVICSSSLSCIFIGRNSILSNSGCILRRRPEKIARTRRSGLPIVLWISSIDGSGDMSENSSLSIAASPAWRSSFVGVGALEELYRSFAGCINWSWLDRKVSVSGSVSFVCKKSHNQRYFDGSTFCLAMVREEFDEICGWASDDVAIHADFCIVGEVLIKPWKIAIA